MSGTHPLAAVESSARGAHFIERLIILGSFLVVVSALHAVVLGDSASSRLATVYSLVHEGTWYIDRPADQPANPFESKQEGSLGGTIDKVELNGRLLSTKPPILPLAMTAGYWLMHYGAGWDLTERAELKRVMQVFNLTLVMIPYLIGLIFFARLLSLLIENPYQRLLPLAALAFGTQLPGFATQLNNHTPAIAALIVALYFAIGLASGKLAPSRHRFFGFGLACALVFTLDMPLTLFVAVAGLGLLYRFPRQAVLWGGMGMLPLLALHFGVMLYVTGSPLPIQMHKDWYLYEASAWRNPGGIDALNEPKGTYLYHMTFGRFGVFLLYPILLIGPFGCLYALRREMAPWRVYYLAGAATVVLLFAYYVKTTNNYGGGAYGFRWGMGAMPIFILMGIPVFRRVSRPWAWAAIAVLMAVSMYSAWECYREPWGDSHEWTCRWLFGSPYLKSG